MLPDARARLASRRRTSTGTGRSTPETPPACGSAPGASSFPCPPPEFDLDAWERTIAEIETRAPRRLALIHFGVFDDVQEHLAELRETLSRWASRVEDGMDEATFVAAARYDIGQTDPELVDDYDRAAPYWHHFRGIERYWRKRREAAATG